MEKQQTELASKVKALKFRLNKTEEVMAAQDRLASVRQRESIVNISKIVIELKENIEEKKFAKGETEEQVAQWSRACEEDLTKTDETLRRLTQQIKEIDLHEEDVKSIQEHKKALQFEREILEQKAEFEKTKQEEGQVNQNKKPPAVGAAKLPKLPITKFNGKIEAWLPFWGKFKSEIDSTDLPALTRFSYLKELLEESVRTDIDGLPFTEDGYTKAKGILESEYGQSAEVVHAYVQNIMSLPAINGTNPKKIHDFYKQLRYKYNVQSLETLGKLADVKGNVRSTLDKLKKGGKSGLSTIY